MIYSLAGQTILKGCSRAIFILTFLPIALIGCSSRSHEPGKTLSLEGHWNLIKADTVNTADIRLDHTRAERIIIPGSWNQVLSDNEDFAATVWIWKSIYIPESMKDRALVLTLGPVAVADETYFNGRFINGRGQIPNNEDPLNYDFAWQQDRDYLIPGELVRYDEDNIISIRIFSHVFSGIKEKPIISTYRYWIENNRIQEHLPSAKNMNIFLFTFTLAIFAFILIKGNKQTAMVLYSIIFVGAIFMVHTLLLGIPRFSNGIYRFKLVMGAYLLVDFLLVMMIQSFFGIRSRITSLVCLASFLIVSVLILIAPNTWFLVQRVGIGVMAIIIGYILCCFIIFIIALYRDPRRYWYLSFVTIFLLVSVISTLYYQITLEIYRMSFTFFLRLPALLFGLMLISLLDLKNIKKERDSLAHALIKKTRELKLAIASGADARSKPEPRDQIHELIEYLDNNFTDSYDRKALAAQFGLNEDYMGQIFKKVTDTNIAHYINTRRIEAARQLLIETDSKVIDIAFHVGFDNLTYFYRQFKKLTGKTPTEYKRTMKERLELAYRLGSDDEVY